MSINWKSDKNGVYFTKVSNFRVEHTPHPIFGEMVTIVKGPSFGSHLFGKKYVNFGKAVGAITLVTGERLASKSSKEESEELMAIREELIAEGYVEL
jgi:hypothetical protein